MLDRRITLFSLSLLLLQPAFAAHAQDATTQSQQLQQQITDGINSGTLSQAEIEALQARQQQLANNGTTGAINQPRVPLSEAIQRYGVTNTANNNSPIERRTTTGPDPFTYNSLGPDAYQAQKYKDPAYNVPAYPTTDPQPAQTSQQYTAPSAGAPYGAGYAQAPFAGTTTGQGQGVYVYRPGTNR